MIYNQSQPSIDTLIDSISVSFVGGAVPEKKVQAFLRDCSGEYIVLIYDKTSQRIMLFNDRLGRLPFFLSVNDTGICLSREFKFLYHFMPRITIDKDRHGPFSYA